MNDRVISPRTGMSYRKTKKFVDSPKRKLEKEEAMRALNSLEDFSNSRGLMSIPETNSISKEEFSDVHKFIYAFTNVLGKKGISLKRNKIPRVLDPPCYLLRTKKYRPVIATDFYKCPTILKYTAYWFFDPEILATEGYSLPLNNYGGYKFRSSQDVECNYLHDEEVINTIELPHLIMWVATDWDAMVQFMSENSLTLTNTQFYITSSLCGGDRPASPCDIHHILK